MNLGDRREAMRTSFDSDACQWPELDQAAYRILENHINGQQLRIWIQPLEWLSDIESENGKVIRLKAANEFSADWVRDHHQKLLEEAFAQVSGQPCKVEIEVEKRDSQK